MSRAFIYLALIPLAACSRSDTLSSDRLDCGLGIKVFSRNAAHCAYYADEGPAQDECPDAVPYRYTPPDTVICSSAEGLTPEWINAVINSAWPLDRGVADEPITTDASMIDMTTDTSMTEPSEAQAPDGGTDATISTE